MSGFEMVGISKVFISSVEHMLDHHEFREVEIDVFS